MYAYVGMKQQLTIPIKASEENKREKGWSEMQCTAAQTAQAPHRSNLGTYLVTIQMGPSGKEGKIACRTRSRVREKNRRVTLPLAGFDFPYFRRVCVGATHTLSFTQSRRERKQYR